MKNLLVVVALFATCIGGALIAAERSYGAALHSLPAEITQDRREIERMASPPVWLEPRDREHSRYRSRSLTYTIEKSKSEIRHARQMCELLPPLAWTAFAAAALSLARLWSLAIRHKVGSLQSAASLSAAAASFCVMALPGGSKLQWPYILGFGCAIAFFCTWTALKAHRVWRGRQERWVGWLVAVLVWSGYCLALTIFNVDHVRALKAEGDNIDLMMIMLLVSLAAALVALLTPGALRLLRLTRRGRERSDMTDAMVDPR